MKKTVMALLLAGLCFGGATAQEKDLRDVPFEEVQQAAEQGDVDAQNTLGVRYSNGEEVPQDYRKAVSWYRKAAEQGHPFAQINLGSAYANGEGVPQDYKLAYVWFSLGTANGDPLGKIVRDDYAKKLPPEALAAAQTLATQYFEKYQPKQ